MSDWLQSFSKYQGFITLVVGVFVFVLYRKQKRDHKRNAAKLVLQEIRYAEQKIRKYREIKSYKLYDKLLPTNSWNDNIHLFIKELQEAQNIDLISDFYSKASYIDTLIATISRQKNNPPIFMAPRSPVSADHSVTPTIPGAQQAQDFQNFIPPQLSEVALMVPPVSQKIMEDVSMSVEFVYNTPVVEKLRKIADKKWYQIF